MFATLTDAWHTVVPPVGDRHGPLQPMLVTLTVVTGLIDAFSYLVLGHVFVANMTGNVVFLAFALVGARGFSIAASATALGAFVVGGMVSGRIVHRLDRRGRMLAVTNGVELVGVTAALILAWTASQPGEGATRFVLIVLLGLSAGTQSGTARKLAVPDLNTSVLTQTIVGASSESRLVGGPGSMLGRRGLAAVAMFLGALCGAGLILHGSKPAALLVAAVLLVPVALLAAGLSRSRPDWDRAL